MRLVLIWCLLYLHLHAIIVYCTCIRRHLLISGLPSWLNCFNPKTWFRDISSYGSHDHLFLACSFGHTLQNLHGIWTPPQQDRHIIYQTSTKLVCKLQVETFSFQVANDCDHFFCACECIQCIWMVELSTVYDPSPSRLFGNIVSIELNWHC